MIARLASIKLNKSRAAIVLGSTIYLWGISEYNFLNDERYLKHELCHVRQFSDHGFVLFICLYLLESIKMGYYDNRFEVEARNAELI